MRVLITGARGQLAADLIRAFADQDVIALDHDALNVGDPEQVDRALAENEPDVVINTAAFHEVDLCESEPEQAFHINAAAPQRLAAACRNLGCLLVHISTDYVFDGAKKTPYVEADTVNPISVYGASKVAGELAIRATTDEHLIVRSTGLYGVAGRGTRLGNFVERMLQLAEEGREIRVVDDQTLTPSFTEDVAAVMKRLILEGARGTYHVTNSGECSWYAFAVEIFGMSGIQAKLLPTTLAERHSPACRPKYSVLAHEGLRRAGIPEPRLWQQALAAYLEQRVH